MPIAFIACHKSSLDLVFKVTGIIKHFHIWKFLMWHKLSSLSMDFFIMSVDTSIEEVVNLHQTDQFDI